MCYVEKRDFLIIQNIFWIEYKILLKFNSEPDYNDQTLSTYEIAISHSRDAAHICIPFLARKITGYNHWFTITTNPRQAFHFN